jgi:hypothetical protein
MRCPVAWKIALQIAACRLSAELPQGAAEHGWNQMQAWFRKYGVLG